MSPAGDLPGEADKAPDGGPSDRSLLRRFRLGSQDAATLLYLRYARRLRSLAKAQCSAELAGRVDVEDIVQSVFGSFFRRASQEQHYDIPAGEDLWKLLLVIALNKIRARGAFHHAAKRDVRRTIANQLLVQNLEASGTEDDPDYAFLKLVIGEALERLPAQHKAMLEFRIEGYDVAEIAQKTGRSKRTVERILHEARNKLSDLLDTQD